MRFAPVLLACVAVSACNRTDPAATPAAQTADAVVSASSGEPQTAATSSSGLQELGAETRTAAPVTGGACNLESIDGTVVPDAAPIAARARRFAVSGWLVDDNAKEVPGEVRVRLYSNGVDGRQWQQSLPQSLERSDVQSAQGGGEGLLKSGFEGEVDTSGLPSGTYAVRLAFSRGELDVVCDNGRAVVLN